jgi:methionine-gamma-lyase
MAKSPEKRKKFKGMSTKAVSAGELDGECFGAVTTPIFQTSTFYFPTEDPTTWEGNVPDGSYIYTRAGNPGITAVEQKIAALENSERALVFASGMAAISTTLLTLVQKGDHIVSVEDLYGTTFSLLRTEMPRYGVDVTFVRTTDPSAIERAITDRTKVIYLESPTNPLLSLVDIPASARIAKAHGIKSVIDSTFASPINQTPIDNGIDLVVHSCTKYMNGHTDLIAGCVAGRKADLDLISKKRNQWGGNADPLGAYLLSRGLKTLALRMQRHNENGLAIARYLEAHPKVDRVYYPGLPSHPQHELAKRQMRGFSGMVSFEVKGERKEAEKVLDSFQLIRKATSLGGVDSLVSMPVNSSHAPLTPQERAKYGIKDTLIRLSTGIEDAQDLIDDLDQALSVI